MRAAPGRQDRPTAFEFIRILRRLHALGETEELAFDVSTGLMDGATETIGVSVGDDPFVTVDVVDAPEHGYPLEVTAAAWPDYRPLTLHMSPYDEACATDLAIARLVAAVADYAAALLEGRPPPRTAELAAEAARAAAAAILQTLCPTPGV